TACGGDGGTATDTRGGDTDVVSAACTPNPCHGHGQCSASGDGFVCSCQTGYAGETCDTCAANFQDVGGVCSSLPPVCIGVPCQNGICRDQGGAAVCTCDPGFQGDGCTECAIGYAGDDCAPVTAGACGDLTAFDWRDAVMYFVMTDRFYDSDGKSDPVEGVSGDNGHGASGQYEGGDLAGVQAKLGYIADLGATTVWITAPFENRNSRGRGTNDPKYYSGYHGYWPSPANIDYTNPGSPTPTPMVESRIGTASALRALITSIHGTTAADGHRMKILVDYVMNHVGDESGLYAAHPGWFIKNEDGTIPLCAPNNWWDDPYWGTRCAFASYLPAFDFYQEAPRAWSIADAVWWAKEFGFDGYRLDAIKHVPLDWLTELRAAIDEAFPSPPGGRFYLVGETFNYSNKELLKKFIDPDTMLDGQFDFPFKFEMCEGVFKGDMAGFATWMADNDGYYQVDGASKDTIMALWVGNHDIPRAIHFASGEITDCAQASTFQNGWSLDYDQPEDAAPYELLSVAFATEMTNPGVPLIYYGDEIGLAGGGDPDNRRMMVWDDDALSDAQKALRERVRALAHIRGTYKALSRGTRTTLSSSADTWVYRMGGCGEGAPDVIVALNRGDADATEAIPAGDYTDLVSDEAVSGGGDVTVPARGFRILRVD
ncbi:MAG: hypothetical protein KC635_04780, partial [Myxococcales bacterium]|nr:hypothetical protein [Myxococcales bacterium]